MKKVLDINGNGVVNEKRVAKLKDFLKRLNEGEVTEELKKEGMQIVKSISPLELSLAEQSLIEDGMKASELRHLCDIHMDVLKDELEELKGKIDEEHVLNTLILEHDEILKLLEKLESLNNEIQKISQKENNEDKFKTLSNLAQLILDAEPHHKREEDVLFPALETLGVTGPTRIMRLEHETLREKKNAIKNLGDNFKDFDIEVLKADLDRISKELCYELKDHIFKENYILYPTAFDVIKSNEQWETMLTECNKIGYCPFTPGK